MGERTLLNDVPNTECRRRSILKVPKELLYVAMRSDPGITFILSSLGKSNC